MTTLAQRLSAALQRHQAGDLAAARTLYQDILQEYPEQADALHLLGVLRDQQGAHVEAVALISRAIAASPGEAKFHGNLGTALLSLRRDEEAEAAYRHALRLDPAYAEGHYNLANLLRSRGATTEARRHFEAAIAIQPGYVQARNNLAMLLWEDLGDIAAAEAQYRLLLQATPHWATARMNYGLFRLSQGQFDGWREYEWRWRSEIYEERDWGQDLPRWDGRPSRDAGLLVWGEQGVGDQILHGTMLADVARLFGGRMFVAVDQRLVGLFERSLAAIGAVVVPRGIPVSASMQCPFGSLGCFVRRRAEDFNVPRGGYLRAEEKMRKIMSSSYRAIAGEGRKLVGLSWRSANRTIGGYKSVPWQALLPILRRPDVQWVCLQYGDVAEEIAAMRGEGVSIHHDDSIDGFGNLDAFAAQVASLDAVVTVSNTSVHVAGAIGVPTALLLARGRGRLWYWPEQGSSNPWYESVSMLHQAAPGDWSGLTKAIERFLADQFG